jgi:hypothetical protein
MKRIILLASACMSIGLFSSLAPAPGPRTVQITVKTKEVRNITNAGALCDYSYTRNNTRVEHGVCVSKDQNPVITSKTSRVYSGTEYKTVAQTVPCTATITGLKSKVKYYVRAYEKLTDGTVIYGGQLSFTTL